MDTKRNYSACTYEDKEGLIRNLPRDPRLRWEAIKYLLRARNTSMAEIAKEQAVTRQAVYAASKKHCARMECAIARKLDVAPECIWPERYIDAVDHIMRHRTRRKLLKQQNRRAAIYRAGKVA